MNRVCALIILFAVSTFCGTAPVFSRQIMQMEPIRYETAPHFGLYYGGGKLSSDKTIAEFYIHGEAFGTKIHAYPAFGMTGEWPWNEWISSYALATYEEIKIRYGKDSGGDELFYSHDLNLQAGIECSLPIFRSERAQVAFKLIGQGGVSGGYGFFSDSKFDNPKIWGYAWGVGARLLWQRFSLAGGIRNTHTYWHTYFSRRTGVSKGDDSFMFDADATAQPFFSLSVALF